MEATEQALDKIEGAINQEWTIEKQATLGIKYRTKTIVLMDISQRSTSCQPVRTFECK
jgi:hypothetical protein